MSLLASYDLSNVDGFELVATPSLGKHPAYGQTFSVPGTATLTDCQFYLSKLSVPTGNMSVSIYNVTGTPGTNGVPTGSAIATSDNVNANVLTNSFQLIDFPFSGANQITLTAGNKYAVVFIYGGGGTTIAVKIGTASTGIAGSNEVFSDNGASWGFSLSETVSYYVNGNTMSRTLVAQENFKGNGTLNSGNAGAFSGVYGKIPKWRTGPALTTDAYPQEGSHGTMPNYTLVNLNVYSFTASTKTISSSDNTIGTSGFSRGDSIRVVGSVSNDGNYTIVSKTGNNIVVKESLVNEAASSAVVQIISIAGAYFTLTGAQQTGFCFDFWYWTGDAETGHNGIIAQSGVNFGAAAPWYNAEYQLSRETGGGFAFAHPGESTTVVSLGTIPLHTWVRFYVYELFVSGFNWTYRIGYQLVGGSEVDVFNRTNFTINNVNAYNVIGINNNQNGDNFQRSIGAVSLSTVAFASDFGPTPNVIPPANAPQNWYATSLTGTALLPSLVNSASDFAGSQGNVTTLALPARPLGFGNANIVSFRGNIGSITSITDTAGNLYLLAGTDGQNTSVYYSYNSLPSAANVVTLNFSSQGFVYSTVDQFKDVLASADPFDTTQRGNGTSPTVTTAAITTTQANSLIFVCGQVAALNETWTPGTGYTLIDQADTGGTDNVLATQYKVVSTIQTGVTTSMTTTAIGNSMSLTAVAFKGAFGGDGTQSNPITQTQLADALSQAGIMGNAVTSAAKTFDNLGNPVGYGDKLILLNDGQYTSFEFVTTAMQRGLWITPSTSSNVIINSYKTIASSGWVQPDAGGAPNVWSTTDTVQFLDTNAPIVFEIQANGERWGMTNRTGANLAAVKATLNANPGSYWQDSSANPKVLYISTFGGGSPNSDGKTRIRSLANLNGAGLVWASQDSLCEKIDFYGPGNYDPLGVNAPNGVGVTDSNNRIGGLLRNCNFYWCGKHGAAFTSNCTACNLYVQSCSVQYGYPFGFGQQSPLVNTKDISTTETVTYKNVVAMQSLLGWATGAPGGVTASDDIWLTHGGGTLTKMTFDSCVFRGGSIDGQSTNVVQAFDIKCMNSATYSLINTGAAVVTLIPCSSSGTGLNAGRDQNSHTAMICALESDGLGVIPIQVNPTTHGVAVTDGTTGAQAGNNGGSATLDENDIPVWTALSSAGTGAIVEVYAEPITGSILIKST